jgi:hypothetical protein
MSGFSISEEAVNIDLAGLYLPSVGFGLLYIEQASPGAVSLNYLNISISYLHLTVVSLVAAVIFHEFITSVSGQPNSIDEPNPMSEATVIQRIKYTIFARGEPSDYPDTYQKPVWDGNIELPKWRFILYFLLLMSVITILSAYLYTVYRLSQYSISQASIPVGAVAFLQAVFLLRIVFANIWPNTYLLDHLNQPSIETSVEEFTSLLKPEPLIKVNDGKYSTDAGGRFDIVYQTNATTGAEEQEILEALIVGYSGTIMTDDFPCKEFRATIVEECEEVATFEVTTEQIEQLNSNKKDMSQLIDEVIESIDYE